MRVRNLRLVMVEVARHGDADDRDGHRDAHQDPFGGGVVLAFFGGFHGGRSECRLQPAFEARGSSRRTGSTAWARPASRPTRCRPPAAISGTVMDGRRFVNVRRHFRRHARLAVERHVHQPPHVERGQCRRWPGRRPTASSSPAANCTPATESRPWRRSRPGRECRRSPPSRPTWSSA